MSPNIQSDQINGFSEHADGAISAKSYQQDMIIAGTSERHIDTPQTMVDLLLEVQSGLKDDVGAYEIGFHVAATVNSIHADGRGHVSIVNGTVGECATYVLLVDRHAGTVETLSEGAKNGLWLDAFAEEKHLQSVDEATNVWDVALEEGQELHVIAVSDGIPMQRNLVTIHATPDQLLLENVKDYLLETPLADVNLSKYLINYAESFKTCDNASVTTQSFTADSPAGHSMLAIFDASDGTDEDMAYFRAKLDGTLSDPRYSGLIEEMPTATATAERVGMQSGHTTKEIVPGFC